MDNPGPVENTVRRQSVMYGGSLAVLGLLFFLRNIRSTVVLALAVPLSVVTTCARIFFGGFTLNLMTLGGPALGVGLMVESAVGILENVLRRRHENHEAPAVAAVAGTREVGTAILSRVQWQSPAQ